MNSFIIFINDKNYILILVEDKAGIGAEFLLKDGEQEGFAKHIFRLVQEGLPKRLIFQVLR